MKSKSLCKGRAARQQWTNTVDFGETRTGTKNTVASQGSIRVLVQNKDRLRIAKFRNILPGLLLACWLYTHHALPFLGVFSSNRAAQAPRQLALSTFQ